MAKVVLPTDFGQRKEWEGMATSSCEENTWCFIVMTWSEEDGMRLYDNGTEVLHVEFQLDMTPASSSDNYKTVWIGAAKAGTKSYFMYGCMDELEFYEERKNVSYIFDRYNRTYQYYYPSG